MKDTKRINGALSATVGTDWIKLEFENHDITIEQLKVYNPYAQEIKRLQAIEQALIDFKADMLPSHNSTAQDVYDWIHSTTGYKGVERTYENKS